MGAESFGNEAMEFSDLDNEPDPFSDGDPLDSDRPPGQQSGRFSDMGAFGSPDPDEEFARENRSHDRDSRRRSGSGGGGGGEERRQLLIRRAIALGIGLVILFLLVLAGKGCLDARKNRSLEDYANGVTQIVNETNTLSDSFFGRLEDPGELSVTEFTSEIESDRSAIDGYFSRVEKLSTPGDMEQAQDSLTLVYSLRSAAINRIAERMSTALGDEGREEAISQITRQMEVLAAGDVLYNHVTRPQIDHTIEANDANAPEMPFSTFMTEPAKWINEGEVEAALGAVAGGPREATDDLIHGTGLVAVTIGAATLDPDVSTTIPAETDPVVEIQVQNQGEADESDLKVSVTVDGSTLEGSIPNLAAGETGTASIPLTPAPSGEVELDVEVEGVPGEQVLDNNEASYTINFE